MVNRLDQFPIQNIQLPALYEHVFFITLVVHVVTDRYLISEYSIKLRLKWNNYCKFCKDNEEDESNLLVKVKEITIVFTYLR